MIKISDNRRFLVNDDGTPFFYLADTAWELFSRLTREETRHYLEDRAAKRFTVIQAVALAESDGLGPNALGDAPLWGNDPARPNEAYFAHVDWTVETAESLGLHIAMLPTWGDKWNKLWGAGPEIFTPENARSYGEFLGRRYKDRAVLWVLGGDRPVETDEHRDILQAMAEGLGAGDGGAHLRTFHPPGPHSSAEYFPDDDWLDLHLWQSGHDRNRDNYNAVATDYVRTPAKPCLDGEPGYEDHPTGFNLDNGYLEEYDVRKAAYWALFAGACGHTYGCHPIWQFWHPGRAVVSMVRRPWGEALHLPGSGQVRHARALLESRPYLTRVPDQRLIVGEVGVGTHHVQATRDEDGDYAFVYVPSGKPVTVDLGRLAGAALTVHWYDPRRGTARRAGDVPRNGSREFTPPAGGPDWVLVLDNPGRRFGAPGQALWPAREEEKAS